MILSARDITQAPYSGNQPKGMVTKGLVRKNGGKTMNYTYTYRDVTLAQAILLINYLAHHTTDITLVSTSIQVGETYFRNESTVSLLSRYDSNLRSVHEALKSAYEYNKGKPFALQVATWYDSKSGELDDKRITFYAHGA